MFVTIGAVVLAVLMALPLIWGPTATEPTPGPPAPAHVTPTR